MLLKTPGEKFAPYGHALERLGEVNGRVVVLGADLGNSTEINWFRDRFPGRFFNVGAAEQNEVGIAAGMAFEGLIPFVHSFGVFVTRRPYEQVCVEAAMHKANVKLIGTIPGLTSRLGPTHQAIDDLSLMRGLPNMTVIDPADSTEIEQVVTAAADWDGPVYIRIMRREVQTLFDPEVYHFVIGKAVVAREGSDVSIVSTGLMLKQALEAAATLAAVGISAEVVHSPTIKPLDGATILASAAKTKRVVTVENHLITGGLGSAVAELLSENLPLPLKRLGLNDTFAVPGSPEYLFERYGLTGAHVTKTVEGFLKGSTPPGK